MAWTKAWGRRPLARRAQLRASCSSWSGVSLWWFAELYLHHSTDAPAPRAPRSRRFTACSSAEAPDEVDAVGLAREETVLLGRTCTARGVLFDGPRAAQARPARRRGAALSWRSRLEHG